MSQLDTGLGWSAKDTYLLSQAPSRLCDKNIVEGAVELPVALTYPDFKAVAIPVVHRYNPGAGIDYVEYYSSDNPATYICAYSASPNIVVVTIGLTQGMRGHTADKNNDGTWGSSWADTTISNVPYNSFYYAEMVYSDSQYTVLPDIPLYSSKQEALDSFVISQISYYKLNPGYAVACVAQWYTTAGADLISPVLISSNPASTILTTDGTTPAADMTTFDFLLDGMRFYMSLIGGNSDPVTTALEYADLRQFAAAMPQKVFALLASDSFSNITVLDSPDPYGQETDPGAEEGGDGDTDPEDDPVDEETMPLPAVVGLGFSTIYVPTQTDLYNLAAYLWGGNLDLTNFLKLFANPMDSILGLSAVPLVLSGTYEPIYLGGQMLQGITMPRYTGRTAVKVDMGTATITERWGAYLDYDPYTELAVYVPFVGIKNIKADDVMGKTIRLMYDIDILSGACIAYIRPEGGSPLYEWSGQCAMQIPITGANWDNIFSTAINTAATLGGALFAPASAPVLGGAVASAASQAIAAKPRIERSGAVNGITGFLGQLRPYIIRTIPEAYIPNDQNKFIGYPSYMSVNLGSLTGYNEIASIHLENIPATGDELSELESILKGGAIF